MRVGVSDISFEHVIDRQIRSMSVNLVLEMMDDNDVDREVVHRMNEAMMNRDANALLHALLEATTGHHYHRGNPVNESTEEPPDLPDTSRYLTGQRALDVSSDDGA